MKFAFLGNLQTSSENVAEEEVKLITIQLYSSILFILTTLISTTLTYDLYLKKTKKQPLFTDQLASEIDAINRTIILALIVILLFVNITYVDVIKRKGEDATNSQLQVITAIFTLVAGSISLYVAYQQLGKDFNFSDVENIEI